MGSLIFNTLPGTRDHFQVNNAGGESCCGGVTMWQLYGVMKGTVPALFTLQPSCSLAPHAHSWETCSPSVVLLLFLLMKAALPGLVSSEPSTELLLIILSSSFFTDNSATAAASSSSSSSWSEYWLRASTSSLKISSLINPPSGTESTIHQSPQYLFPTGFKETQDPSERLSGRTSVAMDTIIVVDEFLQEGFVLFQHLVAHVGDVVEESLIFHLRNKNTHQNTTCDASEDRTVASYLRATRYKLRIHKIFAWSCVWTFHSTKMYINGQETEEI